MTGMLLAVWAAADLTIGRLLLAAATTGYVAVEVYFEERSLGQELGDVYLEYKSHVPAVIPSLRPAWPPRIQRFQGADTAPEAV